MGTPIRKNSSFSFALSSPSNFGSTGPSSGFASAAPSDPTFSRTSSVASLPSPYEKREVYDRYLDLVNDDKLPEKSAGDFRNLLHMFETMSDALHVEMLPPNLGEVLPESLSPSDLSLVHYVSYEAMAFLDAIRISMHKELEKIRDIFAFGLPDLRRIKPLPELATACKVSLPPSLSLSQI
jgi:hypothetical protein